MYRIDLLNAEAHYTVQQIVVIYSSTLFLIALRSNFEEFYGTFSRFLDIFQKQL